MSIEMFERLNKEINALAEYLGVDILSDKYGNVKIINKNVGRQDNGGNE